MRADLNKNIVFLEMFKPGPDASADEREDESSARLLNNGLTQGVILHTN